MTEAPQKKRRVSAKGARQKGFQLERDLIAYMGERLGLDIARGNAGAQAFNQAAGSSDLYGLPRLAPEVKRTERFLLDEFMAQAIRNATGTDMPLVIHRKSRQRTEDASVVLRLSDFCVLYESFLAMQGFKRTTG